MLVFALIGSLLLVGWLLALLLNPATGSPTDAQRNDNQRQSPSGSQLRADSPPPSEPLPPTRFAVSINRSLSAPRVATGLTDVTGREVTHACQTCHATRTPNPENRQAPDLNEFHAGLPLNHGNISCLSCHNSTDYDALKLADGTRVEFSDVMTLCSQCHGTQRRDYDRGAHGGMTGYWDLSRGPRQRNNCVDCHQPHAPQFPHMQPTFKPRDRFLEGSTRDIHEKHE